STVLGFKQREVLQMRVAVTEQEIQKHPFKEQLRIQTGHTRQLPNPLPDSLYRPGIFVVLAENLEEIFAAQFLAILRAVEPADDVSRGTISQVEQSVRRNIDAHPLGNDHAQILILRQQRKPFRLRFENELPTVGHRDQTRTL